MAPSDFRAHYYAGEYFRQTSQPDSAETCFKRALSIEPRAYLPQRGLARVYRDQGRLDEAESTLIASISQREDFYADMRELGIMYYRVARYDSAAIWLQRAVDVAPDDVSSLNALGGTYHMLGDAQRAATMWERSFRLSPNCDNCNNIGMIHFVAGRYRESAEFYEMAFAYCDSLDYLTWGSWAVALYWADEKKRAQRAGVRAIELAREKLKQDPDDDETLGVMVDYTSLFGTRDELLQAIEAADVHARNDPDLQYRIGTAYEMIGERNVALTYIGDAIRHGYPAEVVTRTPGLRTLCQDPKFTLMLESMQENVTQE
jgi:serine/threonine-protein kinase